MAKTTQVRTYTVREGLLDEWAQRWKAEILPLLLEWGFAIGGAWVDREHNQFVWLITYEGPETFAERNAMYSDSCGPQVDGPRSGRLPRHHRGADGGGVVLSRRAVSAPGHGLRAARSQGRRTRCGPPVEWRGSARRGPRSPLTALLNQAWPGRARRSGLRRRASSFEGGLVTH